MKRVLLALAVLPLVACAHLDRREVLAANRYDVMTDEEIARTAVKEAVGELHRVDGVAAETGLAQGTPAFASREERLSFDRRVDALVRAHTYGQGPVMELLKVRCERLQHTGWRSFPGDALKRHLDCDYSDAASVHEVYKKPLMQRAYVDVLLEVAHDAELSESTRLKLDALRARGVEGYSFVVDRWEHLEGFRPRG
jgi:hypothetical protein